MAGVIDTTYTFTATDLVTSSKLNNICEQSSFTADAIDGGTLTVTAGKLKVSTTGITATELASNAVTTAKILDGAVTTGKLATGAVTATSILDLSITAGKIADATITIGKMATAALATTAQMQSETADVLVTADKVKQSPTAAKAYGSFTYESAARTLSGGYNVASVTQIDSTKTQVTFTNSMANTTYVAIAGTINSGSPSSTIDTNPTVYNKTITGFKLIHADEAAYRAVDFVVFGTLA